MNRIVLSALLAASVLHLSSNPVAADGSKKGGTAAPSAPATAEPIVLKNLKPGMPVRVSLHNEWLDGKVVSASESQISVVFPNGAKESGFTAEKVWGTEEQQDNAAAGGYIDDITRANFESFKAAVAKIESLKKSGAATEALLEAVDEATDVLDADYAKARRHPRIGPFLARYWAVATMRADVLAAAAVAEIQKAAESTDFNVLNAVSSSVGLDPAKAVVAAYKEFQTEPNAETARLDKLIADSTQKFDAAKVKALGAILEAARVPKETYKGSDKAMLKAKVTAAWKAQFPGRPIMKLVIDTDWDHVRTWETNASAAGGYWYDWTTITLDVVVKKDATTATVFPVAVSYQDGNKKKLTTTAGDQGTKKYSPYDVLLKNVK